MKRGLFLALVSMMIFLPGCIPEPAGDSGCPVCPHEVTQVQVKELETIDQGVVSGVRDQRMLVIRDLSAWQALWAEHKAGHHLIPPLPYVDFAHEMVIGVFLGEKPTSGYNVVVVGLRQTEEGLIVRVRINTPPPGVALLQVLTQPYYLVKVPRYDGLVGFEIFVVEGQPRA